MKASRQLGLCAAVFSGLLLLYVGGYLATYKNDLGREVFGNTYRARGAAHLLHRASAHFFAPLRFLERHLAEKHLKRSLRGKWTSASGSRTLSIHDSGKIVLTGFEELGAPEGTYKWRLWAVESSGDYGDPAVPWMVISCSDLPTALEVNLSRTSPNEIEVWRAGYRGGPELMQRQTTSSGN
jgi:hypothetical protein